MRYQKYKTATNRCCESPNEWDWNKRSWTVWTGKWRLVCRDAITRPSSIFRGASRYSNLRALHYSILQIKDEHCTILGLPCGKNQEDVLQQATNLEACIIPYLQQKKAAGIINTAAPGMQQVISKLIAFCLEMVRMVGFYSEGGSRVMLKSFIETCVNIQNVLSVFSPAGCLRSPRISTLRIRWQCLTECCSRSVSQSARNCVPCVHNCDGVIENWLLTGFLF